MIAVRDIVGQFLRAVGDQAISDDLDETLAYAHQHKTRIEKLETARALLEEIHARALAGIPYSGALRDSVHEFLNDTAIPSPALRTSEAREKIAVVRPSAEPPRSRAGLAPLASR